MAQRFEILCYGHDQTLLDTRRMILELSYRVETATSLAEVARFGGILKVDLVVLCHTVPEEEARRVIQISGALWPRSGILSIQPLAGRDTVCKSVPQVDSAPQHLKDRIRLLLEHESTPLERNSADDLHSRTNSKDTMPSSSTKAGSSE